MSEITSAAPVMWNVAGGSYTSRCISCQKGRFTDLYNHLLATQMHPIRLLSSMCLIACVAGCDQGAPPMRVTDNLSSNDVSQIVRAVHEGMTARFHSATGRPLKSMEATTNCLYEFDRAWVSRHSSEVATNPAAEKRLHEMQKRLESERPRPAVEVWYADRMARWGEAGFIVEKETNEWKITVELFR
jgi:hypothetical protein